jgi:Fe2+ transport system protein B
MAETQKEILARIDQKLNDFIDNHNNNDEQYRDGHKDEHKIMWRLIIGLPTFLLVMFGIFKVIGG